MTKAQVLVVEDDTHLLSGIREILELEHYAVTTATNGLEGLRVLRERGETPPDIIVSDIMMPHLDGFGFLDEVRKTDDWMQIPFIFLTAKGEKDDLYRGRKQGADDYLKKPFDANELLNRISTCLRRAGELNLGKAPIDVSKKKIIEFIDHEFTPQFKMVGEYADRVKVFQEVLRNHVKIDYLREVSSGADRLRRLVENFITLVEVDTGDAARTFGWRKREIYNLETVIHEAYAQIAANDVHELVLHIAPDAPKITADSQFLTIAIRELLDNAAKFSPPHTPITVTATAANGNMLAIAVQDVGAGIPADEFTNIWLPFYQLNPKHLDDPGTGSGLAVVDGVLKIHSGKREVVSEVGKGSTFTIYLPVTPPTLLNENITPPPVEVLVVEDDTYLLSGIRDILSLENYNVVTAVNGLEALRVLQESGDAPPDIIVSDVMMPHLDGIGFLKEVRKNSVWLRIPFIFLSAKGEKSDVYDGWKEGAELYLKKPFDALELVNAIESRIDRHAKIKKVLEAKVAATKRKILTILNHELRTPLTLVVAYADMLKDFTADTMSQEEVVTFLKGVNSGADRLHRLIENFIYLIELENGEATAKFAARRRAITNLPDLAHTARVYAAQPEHRPREFRLNVPADLPPVMGDVEFLTVAIRELLDNGAKFSPPNGLVTLDVSVQDNHLLIAVTDTGRGIPAHEFENIWEPFYQIKREEFEDQGAGSGLAIVRRIAQLHGGTATVQSEAGKGSTFTLALPLQPL